MDRTFEDWATARLARLVRFAYLVTGSQEAADDAVQTALTSACSRWKRIQRTDDPDAYVRRMVVNAHISTWRRTTRREAMTAGPRERTADDVADGITRDDLVWRACRSLPPQQRAAVVLRYYEDLDDREIAHILGVTETTVRSHVHRGLTGLRSALAQEELA